jgi:hypothetical protein
MIIDVKNNIPPNYRDYAVRMERTGEIHRRLVFYADDEAGYFDRYTQWPPKLADVGYELEWERVHACIKIIRWPINAPVTVAGYRTARD